MSQSLSAVHVHLVFSTKGRSRFLQNAGLRTELHAYLGGVSRQIGCQPVQIGGVADHVHVLAQLGRTISQADWVKELKRVSSVWLKARGRDYADFQWQGGYAAFSVSRSNLERVVEYIANQESHHRELSFQDELRALLRKHQLEFDERYIWD